MFDEFKSKMPGKGHKSDCTCPPCCFSRGENLGRLPQLCIRIDPELKNWILNRPEGARQYVEALVNLDLEKHKDFIKEIPPE